MNLVLLGLSHRTAPLEVRERCAVSGNDAVTLSEKLVQLPEIEEAAILSTCNRTEIIAAVADPEAALERLHGFLRFEIADGGVEPHHLYEARDEEAVDHLFRVASSLDSMVLGEAQILGQVKQAYRAAVAGGACGPILNRLFHRAFRAAKRVRTETGLGGASVSVARVGVQLAREIFESFEEKSIVLVGAGEMAESALHGFREAGARDLVVVNRSIENANRLARQLSGRAAALDGLEAELQAADVALTSIQVSRPILEPQGLRTTMRRRHGRPLLLIDLGIPRNVHPSCNAVSNVYLYDLDDLEGVAEQGRARRVEATGPATQILIREREQFWRWQHSLAAVPTIRELLGHAGEVARGEVRRTLGRLPDRSPETERALERMAEMIVAKLLHPTLQRLRREAQEREGAYYAEAARALFGLEEEEDA